METTRTIILENGDKVQISEASHAALVDAAREPVGGELLASLPNGEYAICGKKVRRDDSWCGYKCVYIPSCVSGAFVENDIWSNTKGFESYIGMKIADLRQHHIKPYTVEWRDMTRREILAFIEYYGKKIVSRSCNSDFWKPTTYHPYTSAIKLYSFAHIERNGTIGEAHKFRCTVDAPHKVEGTDYEF